MKDVKKKHHDYLGNELEIGDEVVYMKVGYRWFEDGVVAALGDKKVTITPTSVDEPEKVLQFYYQVIKKF